MAGKVIPFPEQMMDVAEWTWSDFRDVWKAIASKQGEDTAWKVIYEIWRHRAGGVKS